MELKDKVEQWKLLKQSKKILDKRLKDLRSDLLKFPEYIKEYGLEVQDRDLTTYEESRVFSLMHNKGIPEEMFTRTVVDEGKIEQLYYDGALTDNDLRYIREPKYSSALVVKEIDV